MAFVSAHFVALALHSVRAAAVPQHNTQSAFVHLLRREHREGELASSKALDRPALHLASNASKLAKDASALWNHKACTWEIGDASVAGFAQARDYGPDDPVCGTGECPTHVLEMNSVDRAGVDQQERLLALQVTDRFEFWIDQEKYAGEIIKSPISFNSGKIVIRMLEDNNTIFPVVSLEVNGTIRIPPNCHEEIEDKGEFYRGCQKLTKSGRTCKNWDDMHEVAVIQQYVEQKTRGIGFHNYCRNPTPDSQNEIWCHTDNDVGWESCNSCDEVSVQEKDIDYRGCQTVTRSGKECKPWGPHQPFWGTDYTASGVGEHNYCRNPYKTLPNSQLDVSNETIWCYTDDGSEYCDRICEGSEEKYNVAKGADYTGCASVTRSGATCVHWHTKLVDGDNNVVVGQKHNHNYCRNPMANATLWSRVIGNVPSANTLDQRLPATTPDTIWCYTSTTPGDYAFELCDPVNPNAL